jgi:hypothetical protein
MLAQPFFPGAQTIAGRRNAVPLATECYLQVARILHEDFDTPLVTAEDPNKAVIE